MVQVRVPKLAVVLALLRVTCRRAQTLAFDFLFILKISFSYTFFLLSLTLITTGAMSII